MNKRALVTGISGQDGSYLAELLLSKGYEVYGLIRRTSTGPDNLRRIKHILNEIEVVNGDLSDERSIAENIQTIKPDEIYNLAAMSFVPTSWTLPEYTFNVNAIGFLNLITWSNHETKIYQASTSEMYGNSYPEFKPISPYGISKLAAHNLASAYRDRGRFICCGICFNHESPRRGAEFVTQKIATFAKCPEGKLRLGNLDASRDWGFAGDYVEAMWLMLQQEKAEDYEIATGETHTIKEFLELALPDWEKHVEIEEGLKRKNEVHLLKGNPERIKELGWTPKVDFKGLVRMMCE